ncbi:MAG: DUF2752 domain-containing protein [Fimbriimonadaceae bacterium]|nr:DUF2752 domain-containing protein [Fimbriimonadaceae bacterium]
MIRLEGPYSRRALTNQLLWFGAWVAVTAVSLWANPDPHGHGTHRQFGLMPCPSVMMFDRPCPGCGLTTAFAHTVRGQFAEAWRAHWFGTFLYALFTATAWVGLYAFVRRLYTNYDTKAYRAFTIAFLGLFLLYGAVRFATMDGFASRTERAIAHAKEATR